MPMKFDQGSPLWGSPPRQKPLWKSPTVIILAVMVVAGFVVQTGLIWRGLVRLLG